MNRSWSMCIITFTLLFFTGSASPADKNEFPLRKQPEIQQVKSQKPVKIKLHRNAKGEYSWDLNGDSVEEIVEADKRLRKLLKIETTGK